MMNLKTLASKLKELNELAQQAIDAQDGSWPNDEKAWNRASAMESKLQTELDYDGSGLSVEYDGKRGCFIVF